MKLAQHYRIINSSCYHYTDRFRRNQTVQEQRPIDFSSNNQEPYNQPFSFPEIRDALRKSHDSATEPDDIHYEMLKNLPALALIILLQLFYDIWTTGRFPSSWSLATIILIPKPGKDPTSADNYRPIALTSCVCKTFERMVNERLMWYLESNHILTELQSGFRKSRGTTDQLVRLESFIREALVCRQHVVSVFLDLEKAYDTTWKYGILRDLSEVGLRGRLPRFIADFLANRQFRVRMETCLPDAYSQGMGVPQGSILSVSLFIFKINSIVKYLPDAVRCSLYLDDFLSRYMPTMERPLEICLNSIQTWADENGFRFSRSKTLCMHFCKLTSLHLDPELYLYGNQAPVVQETKFLGLIFDSKLNVKAHMKYLRDRGTKALSFLKVLAHTGWGADCATLLEHYRSHVRSKRDYGCLV
jgi:hypothetical protein